MPLPLLRMLDLARALARDPQLLILDEITAALPSDLAERVFAVMRRQKERGRSALFITHRLREVIAHCDRATVLRDGGDVGTLVPQEGGEEKIVEFMLGEEVARAAGGRPRRRPERGAGSSSPTCRPRSRCAASQVGETLADVSLRAPAGRDPRDRGARSAGPGRALRRALRPAAPDRRRDPRPGEAAARAPSLRRDPRRRRARSGRPAAGAAAAALDRREHRRAALQQRAALGAGRACARSAGASQGAIDALSIDTRAQRQVRRLSGGNQQKVTIARWLANGLPDAALLRPDARASTSARSARSTRCCGSSPATARPCSSSRASWPRSRSSATASSASTAAGDRRARRRRRRRGDAPARDARARRRGGQHERCRRRAARATGIHWRRLARRHGWTVGVYVLLVAL